MKFVKALSLTVLITGLAIFATACVVSDYDGWANHDTQAEAKLWGKEVAFSGTGDPGLDGTYSYTVKYDNRNGPYPTVITTYANPVVGSFSRDGMIDRDGDDIQGRQGILGGKFLPRWVYEDNAPGCQFFANQKIPNPRTGDVPAAALCSTASEEVDKDMDLQGSDNGAYGSVSDLIDALWSNATGTRLSANIVGLTLNGVAVPVSPVAVNFRTNGLRPTQVSIDLSGPNGAAFWQAIENNTFDGVPVSLSVQFEGGMSLALPSNFTAAFDHDAM